jgi:hypothetical protein
LKWSEGRAAGRGTKEVVLFADTFNCYYEPEIGKAAFELLERLGYNVIIPRHGCCGRTYMSKGFVEDARRNARQVVDALHEYASRGIAIVGLEPSCILSLRDEYHSLLPRDPQVKTLSDAACTREGVSARAGDTTFANWSFTVTAIRSRSWEWGRQSRHSPFQAIPSQSSTRAAAEWQVPLVTSGSIMSGRSRWPSVCLRRPSAVPPKRP